MSDQFDDLRARHEPALRNQQTTLGFEKTKGIYSGKPDATGTIITGDGSASITVDLRGSKDLIALLWTLSDRQLNNRIRRATRRGAAIFRTELRTVAKSRSDLPKTYGKTRTRYHRNPIGTSVSPGSPLSNIFEHGAGQHSIGRPGQLLYNAAAPFVARGPVQHPGVRARPVIGPAFSAAEGRAVEAMRKELFGGI